MALFKYFSLSLALALAASQNACQSEYGAIGSDCPDEGVIFLQMSKRAASGSRESSSIEVAEYEKSSNYTAKKTHIAALNCRKYKKPIQIYKVETGYVCRELNITSGEYVHIFDIKYDRITGGFSEINGCGINPMDSIIYCAIFAPKSKTMP